MAREKNFSLNSIFWSDLGHGCILSPSESVTTYEEFSKCLWLNHREAASTRTSQPAPAEWVCSSCCFSSHTLPRFSLLPWCRQTLPSDWSRFSASKMFLICVATKRFHTWVSNHVTTRQTENTLISSHVYTTYWRCDDSSDIPSSLNLAGMANEKSLPV